MTWSEHSTNRTRRVFFKVSEALLNVLLNIVHCIFLYHLYCTVLYCIVCVVSYCIYCIFFIVLYFILLHVQVRGQMFLVNYLLSKYEADYLDVSWIIMFVLSYR